MNPLRVLGPALALALAGLGYARGCAGPRPEVVGASLVATPGGLVPHATIRNRGGEGEVDVRFRVVDLDRGGALAAQARARLRRGETVDVGAEGALVPAGRYAVSAETSYPPD